MAGRCSSGSSWSGLQSEGSYRSASKQHSSAPGAGAWSEDAGSALVSVRDARQQRYERTTGRPPSAKAQQQSSPRVNRDPALSTSLAAAFRRPPTDKVPSFGTAAVTAAQHMAASFAAGPPRRTAAATAATTTPVTATTATPTASAQSPVTASSSSLSAASASSFLGGRTRGAYSGSSFSGEGGHAAASPLQPSHHDPSLGSRVGPGFSPSSNPGSTTGAGSGHLLSPTRSGGLPDASPISTLSHSQPQVQPQHASSSPFQPPHSSLQPKTGAHSSPGSVATTTAASVSAPALLQNQGKEKSRPLVPSTSGNGRSSPAQGPAAAATGSIALSSAGQAAGQSGGLGSGQRGPGSGGSGSGLAHGLPYSSVSGSGTGQLPPHIASLLADPPPLLPPNEDVDGDTATALALHDAREEGCLKVTMRGLRQLPTPVVRFLRVEGLNLRQLSLTGNRLTALPAPEQLSNLLSLDLSANQLPSLPDCLHHLGRLQTLSVAENCLSCLPPSLSALTCLMSLDAGSNQIEQLPQGLAALSRLQHVKLDRNQLQCLPAGLFTLPTLRTVSACHNQLVGLPVELGAAGQLERLALHHNRLTALPDTIGDLQQALTELLISDNHLTILPRELARLSRLQHLTTSGNPLIFPPRAVCRRGLTAIRVYLMQHLDNWEGEGSQSKAAPEQEPARDEVEQGGCAGCRELEVQVQTLGSTALQQQLDRERAERETAAVRTHLQQQEQLCASLDQQVRQLLADKLSSERGLHARSAQHLASAEDLERQVLHLRMALREAEGAARAAEERQQEAQQQLEVERQRAAAAMQATLGVQADAKRMQELQQQLFEANRDIERLEAMTAHHQFQQRAAEDRQAEAEAKLDQLLGRVQAATREQEATHQLLAVERCRAAVQAAEAQQRERHLETEVNKLQAQMAALLSEREQLYLQHLLSARVATACAEAGSQTDRMVAPNADTLGEARREAARSDARQQVQWRQPQRL